MSTVRMTETMMTTRKEAATLAATSWGLQARMTLALVTPAVLAVLRDRIVCKFL